MRVDIRLPLPGEQIFRYEAMDDILEITAQNPTDEFSNRELQSLTGFGGPSVSKALSLLGQLGLIDRRDAGNRTLYRINEQRLTAANDSYLAIPQPEFRGPIRSFVDRVDDELDSLAGIICFGSVARGEADRVSDIDLFVLIDDDELVAARRIVSDVKRELESASFDGDRYEFEVFVESDDSARKRGADLRPIFQEGITLFASETLQQVKRSVFGGDSA